MARRAGALLLLSLVASALGEGVTVTHLTTHQARSGFAHSCNHAAAYAGSLHVALAPLRAITSLEWKLSSDSAFGQAAEICNLAEGTYQLNFRAKAGGDFKPSMVDVAFLVKEDRTTVVLMKAMPQGSDPVPDCVPHKDAVATTRTNAKGTKVTECKCNEHYSGDGAHCWPIDYCAATPRLCHRNATCSSPEGRPVNCSCKPTFAGDGKLNCVPIDYCADEPCDERATCKSWKGQANCTCQDDYAGNGFNCTRKPACQTSANDCHENGTCTATPGGITCACNTGFDGNGRFCEAQTVCASNGGCPKNSTCANVEGLRECTCNVGFESVIAPVTVGSGGRSGPGFKCVAINRCAMENGGCDEDAICTQTGPGTRRCTCKETFEEGAKEGECSPINYCKAGGGCDKNALCTPLEGSRSCKCNGGYGGNGINCALNGGCGADAAYARVEATPTCEHFNTHPVRHSYPCAEGNNQVACKSGFASTLSNCPNHVVLTACTEIDLCAKNNGGCGDTSIVSCNKTGPGQMICSCKRGYKMNATGNCEMRDTCLGGADCHKQAICNQTGPAMHTCKCRPGYTGDGKVCTPINYCKRDNACGPMAGHACTYLEPTPCLQGTGEGDFCDATNTTLPAFKCSCKYSKGLELNESAAHSAAFAATHYAPLSAALAASESCIPIDNCAKGTNVCNTENGVCNYVGPNLHDCKCNKHYKGDGVSCTGIDRCQTNNGGCSAAPAGLCTSLGPNVSTCACAKFYVGNGFNCSMVDMCNPFAYGNDVQEMFRMKPNGGCHRNADCLNIGGAGERVCSCKTGYARDAFAGDAAEGKCNPVNVCEKNNGGCDARSTCESTGPGTRKCMCPLGYTGESTDGFTGCVRTNFCKMPPSLADDNRTANSTASPCNAAATCTPSFPALVESTQWVLGSQKGTADNEEAISAGETFATCESICEGAGYESRWAAEKENVTTFTFKDDAEAYAAFKSVGVICEKFAKAASIFFIPATSDGNVCRYSLPTVNANFLHFRMNGKGQVYQTGHQGLCRCSSKKLVQPSTRFACACNQGYKGNGVNCEERNPCSASELSECGDSAGTKCTYTGPGRHSCSCITGYEGNPKVGCSPVDNCAKEPPVCGDNSNCNTTSPGQHKCTCELGYVGRNSFSETAIGIDSEMAEADCVPIDNCKINNGNCGAHTVCTYVGPATHTCKCKANYKYGIVRSYGGNSTRNSTRTGAVVVQTSLSLGRKVCVPIDPCTEEDSTTGQSLHNCPTNAHSKCVFLGANKFKCECKPGYFGNGQKCSAINPCLLSNGGCINAICKSGSPGQRTCTCKPHFKATTPEDTHCTKINYCNTNNGGCSSNAQCAEGQVLGAVRCTCNQGFSKGPANTCEQINPCVDSEASVCGENSLCQHTGPGSNNCSCRLGYENVTGNVTGSCSPINACKKPNVCPVNSVCNSTGPNTKTCSCMDGYSTTPASVALDIFSHKSRDESPFVEFSLKALMKIVPEFQLGMTLTATCNGVSTTLWVPARGESSRYCPPGLERGPTGDRYYGELALKGAWRLREQWDGKYIVLYPDAKVALSQTPSCEEINLCAVNKGDCAANADCTFTGPGTRSCNCSLAGYEGDGVSSCEPIKACAKNNGGCGSSICTEVGPGTKVCSCPTGYKFGDTAMLDADLAAYASAMNDTSPAKPSEIFCESINPCEKANGGCALAAECSHDGPNQRSCSCNSHYEGDGEVCTAIKYCSRSTAKETCSVDADCSEVENPTDTDKFTCTCNAGYAGDGSSCQVIDLCKPADIKAKGPCNGNATCRHNILTGVKCTCKQGFKGDGKELCTAIDRCDDTSSCEEAGPNSKCVFTGPGKRDCVCTKGYAAKDARSVCLAVDKCKLNNGNCSSRAACKSTGPGTRTCKCQQFYTGSGIGASGCTEKNICESNGGCAPNATCARVELGKRSCTCPPHHTSLGGGMVCEQTNYCSFPASCDTNAKCVSFLGGKNCSCNAGYKGNGQVCTEIDYCAECVANTICQAPNSTQLSSGSFVKPECLCKDGYTGDGKKLCTEINHCKAPLSPCGKNEGCHHRGPGVFDCECSVGFFKNSPSTKGCAAIDPCLSENGGCSENAQCSNPSTGEATCVCKAGYWGDGKTCKSIVQAETDGRHVVCHKFAHVVADDGKSEDAEIRHYGCKCLPGYAGNGVECTKV